jgi:hypothetical protein
VQEVLPTLIELSKNKKLTNDKALLNIATLLGRLGLSAPDLVAADLPKFATFFCRHVLESTCEVEKDTAIRGMVAAISINPSGFVAGITAPHWSDNVKFVGILVVNTRPATRTLPPHATRDTLLPHHTRHATRDTTLNKEHTT